MDFPAETPFLLFHWAGFLRVTGDDASSFLQGQFSQDVRKLTIGGPPVYGLLLSHKGRVQADAFILRTADGFRLASYECWGDSLRARLESYIIADDVAVEDLTAEYAGISVLSDSSPAVPEGGFVFPGRRALTPNWEIVYPLKLEVERVVPNALGPTAFGPELGQILSALGTTRSTSDGTTRSAREMPALWWESLRIHSGIPSVPRDVGPTDLPQEAGLTADAVSFDKGCYLGQEIMARLKTRGRIRRGLRVVRGKIGGARSPSALAVPASLLNAPGGRVPPAALFWQGKPVGELRTWVTDGADGWIGLAMVLVDVPAGAEFSFA